MKPTIEVRVSRLAELLTAERKLDCLEAMGVDNWEGYDEAMSNYRDAGGKVRPIEAAVRFAQPGQEG